MTAPLPPNRSALLAIVMTMLLVGSAAADRWAPFEDHRVVSPNGRRYVVIRERKDWSIGFELCERRVGASPLEDAEISWTRRARVQKPTPIDRDPLDRLLATGTVKQLPVRTYVLDDGGFVLYEQYHGLGGGHTITYVDDRGKVALRRKLTEIFGAVPTGSIHSASSIHWERGHWLDRARRSMVLISVRDELREVSLDTGKVTSPDLTDLHRWCRDGTVRGRGLALEVLARRVRSLDTDLRDDLGYHVMKRAIGKVVGPEARKIAEDPGEPLALRLRAVVFLARCGGDGLAEKYGALFLGAIRKGHPDHVRFHAAVHLPEVMGVQARSCLEELVRTEPELFDNEWVRRAVRKCAAQ